MASHDVYYDRIVGEDDRVDERGVETIFGFDGGPVVEHAFACLQSFEDLGPFALIGMQITFRDTKLLADPAEVVFDPLPIDSARIEADPRKVVGDWRCVEAPG